MREDGKTKTRDSQKWKRVEVNKKRSYAEVVRRSRYQEEADIGAGTGEEADAGGGQYSTVLMSRRLILCCLSEIGPMYHGTVSD